MANMNDIEEGLDLAYRKALADLGRGNVSREDLMVAGRGLGYADFDIDLDRIVHTPPDQKPDVIILHSSPLRRKGGAQ